MPNLTSTYKWQQPLVNDPIDADVWGQELNSNLAAQDTLLSTVGITTAGALVSKTNNFSLVDGTDATKILLFNTTALTTGTTRTLSVQDVSGTIYVTGGQKVSIADGGTGADTVSAIQASFGIFQHMQVFSANGTFTPAANVTRVYVEVWGSGAAGGGATISNGSAAGGGAGGYAAGYIDVTPSTGCAVVVGTGAIGGTSTGANGNPSSFAGPSLTISATGGTGGTASTGPSVGYAGGAGGTGTNGSLNITGQTGSSSLTVSGQASLNVGAGGNAPRGGVGGVNILSVSAVNSPGMAGSVPGGGGSGALRNTSGNVNGGNGADGMVIVYYP